MSEAVLESELHLLPVLAADPVRSGNRGESFSKPVFQGRNHPREFYTAVLDTGAGVLTRTFEIAADPRRAFTPEDRRLQAEALAEILRVSRKVEPGRDRAQDDPPAPRRAAPNPPARDGGGGPRRFS